MVVTASLPGIQSDEMRVELSENVLVIYSDPQRPGGARALPRGRRFIPVPATVEHALATAEFANGVLTVTLPLASTRKHRQLPVVPAG